MDIEVGVIHHKSVSIHVRRARNQAEYVNQTVSKRGMEATTAYIRSFGLFRVIADIITGIIIFWDTALCGFVNIRSDNTLIDGLA